MAWALYQIVPVGTPDGFVPYTYIYLDYYDISVRNSFGNYCDALKEIAWNNIMVRTCVVVGVVVVRQ